MSSTPTKRTSLVKTMCIITWVLLGIAGIVSLLSIIGLFALKGAQLEGLSVSTSLIVVTILSFVMLIVAFIGTLKIWKMQKIGFYLFTGAIVINQILPLIMIPGTKINPVGIIIALVMIVLFGLDFKKMK